MTLSDLERRPGREGSKTVVSFDLERPNSVGQQMWGGTYFQGMSHAPTARERKAPMQRSPIFDISFYLFVRPVTQNDQI